MKEKTVVHDKQYVHKLAYAKIILSYIDRNFILSVYLNFIRKRANQNLIFTVKKICGSQEKNTDITFLTCLFFYIKYKIYFVFVRLLLET